MFLVIFNKQLIDSKIYLAAQILVKIALSIFIQYYLFANMIEGIKWEDKLVFSFAASILSVDAIINDLPILLKQYNVPVSDYSKIDFLPFVL